MTEHTPGPWECGQNHVGTGTVAIRHHTGDTIAYTTCKRQEYGDPFNDAEALANARLIASAPELLEALERLVDCDLIDEGGDATHPSCVCCHAWGSWTGPGDRDHEDYCAWMKAKAAIAKAKGQ